MAPLSSSPVADKRLVSMALLVALGVVLHRVEALLPLPSPWIKLGLANIMTLLAVVYLGFRDALVVTALRVVLGSLLGGTFLGPTFFLSFAGGMAATGVMAGMYRLGARRFSLVGVSVAAAVAHTLAVAACVYLFFIQQEVFFHLVPVFMVLALFSGILTGVAANLLAERLNAHQVTLR